MSSASEYDHTNGGPKADDASEYDTEEAREIVRALKGGEVDAVIVEDQGEHQLMALAKLTDLDEINELIRALKSGEVDAFITQEDGSEKIYSFGPIQEFLAQQYYLTKAIADNATTALFILDENQKCVFMNPAAEQLTGFTFEEVRGRGETFHQVIHHTHADGTPYPGSDCPINRAFPTRSQQKGEEIFFHKDGHQYRVAFAASPIVDAEGEPSGTVVEVRDITERKKIEQTLKDADRRKDEFIATLAHELRNPLAPISNLLALMKQADYDPDVARAAHDTIERQLTKMVRLVDDLLDVSRITRNTIELRREPIELADALSDAVDTCRPLIEQSGHSLRVELPDEPIFLNADGARISQVLCNLINNACKFTPAGGDITVSARASDGDALIKVKDSGIGIPPEQLENIFDMFSQVGAPVSDNQSGLGIGLALAKQLVKMHGGSIVAKSNADSPGSEFIVRLPRIETAAETAPKPAATRKPAPSGRRILVVDDNFDSAESMSTFLGVTGNNCRMAHSGQQALDMAEEFSPDVILLDIGLPGMDGYEVCRIIREQPWGEDICVIAMTGWGQPDDRQRSADAGFNAHLVKPVDITKLYELINTVSPRKQA